MKRSQPCDPALAPDIDGALIIAEQEELAGNNATLDYVINDNGTCTCKLCGEVTQSRTHWYRHKYKVKTTIFLGTRVPLYLDFCRCIMFACFDVKSVKYSSKARRVMKATWQTDILQGRQQ